MNNCEHGRYDKGYCADCEVVKLNAELSNLYLAAMDNLRAENSKLRQELEEWKRVVEPLKKEIDYLSIGRNELQNVINEARDLIYGQSADSVDNDEYPALKEAVDAYDVLGEE